LLPASDSSIGTGKPAPVTQPCVGMIFLKALTNDERIVVAAGREAWASITKTFETWVVLGEAIVTLRNKADNIGGRKAFLRLLDQNGLGKIDGGEISRLEKIMANIDAVRAWHKGLPLNRQIAWSSPSSVIRNALNADGSRLSRQGMRAARQPRGRVLQWLQGSCVTSNAGPHGDA
jgi:hypothetical protein